jgi:ABC-type nitrate/sulfonate/bicarbonate transport system permease component
VGLLRKLAGIAGFLLLWQVVAISGVTSVDYFPTLPTIAAALVTLLASADFLTQVAVTCEHSLAGLALAIVIGLGVAILGARVTLVRRSLEPLVGILRVLPPPALVPISIFVFGIGPRLFLFIIAFASLWPIYINAGNALAAAEPVQILTGRSLGLSKWQILLALRLPAAMPEIVTGIRIGGGIALLAAVATEMLAGENGLGFVLYNAAFTLQVPEMFAAMLVIGLIGVGLNLLLAGASRRVIGWHLALSARGGYA